MMKKKQPYALTMIYYRKDDIKYAENWNVHTRECRETDQFKYNKCEEKNDEKKHSSRIRIRFSLGIFCCCLSLLFSLYHSVFFSRLPTHSLTHSLTHLLIHSHISFFLLSLDSSVSSASSNEKVEPGKKSLCSTIKVRDEKVKTLTVERKNEQNTTSSKGTYSTCFRDKQFVSIEL